MTESFLLYFGACWVVSKLLRHFGIQVKLSFAVFVALFVFGALSLLVAFSLNYRLPSGLPMKGKAVPYVPLSIAVLQFGLAWYSRSLARSRNWVAPEKPAGHIWWILTGIGVIPLVSSYAALMFALFSPDVFGASEPVPNIGVAVYVIASPLVAIPFYFFSRYSIKKQNDLAWYAFNISVYCTLQVTILSLMLVYAGPGDPRVTYPFLGSIMTLAYIPYTALVCILAKARVRSAADAK